MRNHKLILSLLRKGLTIENERIIYLDVVGVFNMNAISIRTQRWGCYMNRLYVDVVANIKPEMKLRAILDSKSFNCQVGTLKESNSLHHTKIVQ